MSVVSLIETPESPELGELYQQIERATRGLGVLNVFKTMAHTPELMRAWWEMMSVALSGRLALSPRLRELAILRVFQLSGGEYGFAHHVRIAKLAGLTDEDIAALAQYETKGRFSEPERLALRYTDAVSALGEGAPGIARQLLGHLSERELVELTFCIANWNLMARLLQPLEIELEPALREYLPADWQGK